MFFSFGSSFLAYLDLQVHYLLLKRHRHCRSVSHVQIGGLAHLNCKLRTLPRAATGYNELQFIHLHIGLRRTTGFCAVNVICTCPLMLVLVCPTCIGVDTVSHALLYRPVFCALISWTFMNLFVHPFSQRTSSLWAITLLNWMVCTSWRCAFQHTASVQHPRYATGRTLPWIKQWAK